MRTQLQIKVCGMKNLPNIRKIEKLAPDFMGYIFYPPSKRYVGNNPDPEIFSIDEKTHKVAVFVDEKLPVVFAIAERYNISFVQLHGNESPGYCNRLQENGIKVIKAFQVSREFSFVRLSDYMMCNYFLFDTKDIVPGGSGKKFDWNLLDGYRMTIPFFISGGIGPDDILGLKKITLPTLCGADINSRFETEPGMKDAGRVHEFINQLKR